jgi:hypothetical protein
MKATPKDSLDSDYHVLLAELMMIQYAEGKTVTWGELAALFSRRTGINWSWNLRLLCGAMLRLDKAASNHHVFSALAIKTNGLPTKLFYERAIVIGLLKRGASQSEILRVWQAEFDYWVRRARRHAALIKETVNA